MKSKKSEASWISFFILVYIPFASLAEAKGPLSWEECIQRTRQNNPELKAALSDHQATEYQEDVSRSSFLPQISANFGYGRSDEFSENSLTARPNNTYLTSIAATQNLFSGFQDSAKLARSKASSQSARAQLQIMKAQISFNLKSSFENLRYSKDYLQLASEIIRRREENLRLVDLRFQSGRENKGSVLLSQAYLKQAQYDSLQAQNAKQLAMTQLAQALGLDEADSLDIQGEIPTQDPGASNPEFQPMIIHTPQYEQALAQEAAADATVMIARSGFLPSINLTTSLNRQASQFFTNFNDRWNIGLNLSLPFFSGGKDFYSVQSAKESQIAASHHTIHTGRELLAKLKKSLAHYTESLAKLQVDKSFKEAASVRAEIARKKYNNGLITFEDWDIIENELIARQKSLLQSKRDRVLAEASWEQSQGKGVIP